MEYALLAFLVTHPGRIYSREVLLSQVWGFDYYGGTRTVDVHIRRLRAKLGPKWPSISKPCEVRVSLGELVGLCFCRIGPPRCLGACERIESDGLIRSQAPFHIRAGGVFPLCFRMMCAMLPAFLFVTSCIPQC
ncbi:MAG: helix-turn-helix domain-containing protein [Slackia sp.]